MCHVDHHGQFTLKQLRLSLVNEMPTNSYTGPRLSRLKTEGYRSRYQNFEFTISDIRTPEIYFQQDFQYPKA